MEEKRRTKARDCSQPAAAAAFGDIRGMMICSAGREKCIPTGKKRKKQAYLQFPADALAKTAVYSRKILQALYTNLHPVWICASFILYTKQHKNRC